MLTGAKLCGSNPDPTHKRADLDYYATNPEAVEKLLIACSFKADSILEPCVGGGNISRVIESFYPSADLDNVDLVDRGFSNTIVGDYLEMPFNRQYDLIITNPPYYLATEFIIKSLSLINQKGHVAMFLKINFLEGKKRKELFDLYPPKYIYVFRNRMATWHNGNEVNPATGKKWMTTFCHAWFVWEEGFHGDPSIKWLD